MLRYIALLLIGSVSLTACLLGVVFACLLGVFVFTIVVRGVLVTLSICL